MKSRPTLTLPPRDRKPKRARSLIDTFMVVTVAIGILVCFLAGSFGAEINGIVLYGLLLTATAVATASAFAPRHIFANPKITATVGTANPKLARTLCIIAAAQ